VTPPDDAVVEPRCARCQCWLGWVRRIAHEESEALQRSLPPPGADSPERGVWITEQIIRDEVDGISTRGAQGRHAVIRHRLELLRKRWD
jgi:hypothetical protein